MDVGARSILIVDDDSGVRGLLVRILEEEGYLVTGVGTTMECLAFVDRGAVFDLIIIDVVMPLSMPNGFALGRMVKYRNPGQQLLYVTGVPEALPEGELETVEIFTKPVRVPEFLQVVRRLAPLPR
jgi:DNA-binding NtrC family response regulator